MTSAVTKISVAGSQPVAIKQTSVFVGGGTSGMTQTQADARYLQKTQVNAPNGVAGVDANAQLPTDQLAIGIDLVTYFKNKLV